MPLPPHLLPLTRFLALMTLVPHGSPGDTTNWIYGGHIDLQSLPSMNSMKEKQEQSGAKQWRIIRNPNGRDMAVVFLFLPIQRGMGFIVCLPPHSKALSDITKTKLFLAEYRPAEVQLVFRASSRLSISEDKQFENVPMAYVLWYTDIPSVPSDTSGMFVVRKALDHANHPQGAVISLNKIIFHCPLHPSIIGDPRPQLTKENISAFATEFYINPFSSGQVYQRVQQSHWRLKCIYSKSHISMLQHVEVLPASRYPL